MARLQDLLENNRGWAEGIKASDPRFFENLSRQQAPRYLWIGCSDSRVPANQIVGLLPGELFVHRNVANIVVHSDLNCLSVLQYAVEVLKIRHVIVCGHYGCGGIQAAFDNSKLGLIDNWLRHVQDVMQKHAQRLEQCRDDAERRERLCELNVIEQVSNMSRTTILQQAWERGQAVSVHGWIYGLNDGLLRDLNTSIDEAQKADARCAQAVASLIGD